MVEGSRKTQRFFWDWRCASFSVHSMYIFPYKTSKANFLLAPSNFRWTLPPGFHARVVTCTKYQLYPYGDIKIRPLHIFTSVSFRNSTSFHIIHCFPLIPWLGAASQLRLLSCSTSDATKMPSLSLEVTLWSPSSRPTNTRNIHRHKANHNLSNCT